MLHVEDSHVFQAPFIICGDFNITAEAMEASPWLTTIGGAAWAPSQPTCTAGQAGSVIDYANMSIGMARSIQGISVSLGPSSPHLAVFCQVNLDLACTTSQVIVVPRALPPLPLEPLAPVSWGNIVAAHSLNDLDSISKVFDPWH